MSSVVAETRICPMPTDGTTKMNPFDEHADNEKDGVPCA